MNMMPDHYPLWNEAFFTGKEPAGILYVPEITEERREEIRRAWDEHHRGLSDARRIVVTPEEQERLTCTMSAEDYAAFLDQVLGEGQSFYL